MKKFKLLLCLFIISCQTIEKKNGNRVFPDNEVSSKIKTIELTIQNGHKKDVDSGSEDNIGIESLAFSPNSKFIISGSKDNAVKLWNLEGRLIHTFEGHTKYVNSVAFSTDGSSFISGSSDGTTRLWSLEGKLLRSYEGNNGSVIRSVAFSPDGKFIISGSDDKKIYLWNVAGKLLRTFEGHTDIIKSVLFSPDGKFIISGSFDKKIIIWTIEGQLLRTLEGHKNEIEALALSPDGKTIASSSLDQTIKLWSIDGHLIKSFSESKVTAFIVSLLFSLDGKHIIGGSSDNDSDIYIWNLDGKIENIFKGHKDGVLSLAISPDGKKIVSGSYDNVIKLWDLNGKLNHDFKGDLSAFNSLAFSPDGKYFICGSDDKKIYLWSNEGKLIHIFDGHQYWITSLAFSPDGKSFITGSHDYTIKLWSIDGKLLHTYKRNNTIMSLAFSPEGKSFISGSFDNTVQLWDIKGKLLSTYNEQKKTNFFPVQSVAFSPDGKSFISSSWDGVIRFWNIDGKLLSTFEGHTKGVHSVSFSPDGKFVISSSRDGTIKLWNIKGKILHSFNGFKNGIKSVKFSPDGKSIVGIHSNFIYFWDFSGNLLHTFKGHHGDVNAFVFSPDGQSLISCSDDSTIKVWDIKSRKEIITLLASSDKKWINITPDYYFDSSPNGGDLLGISVFDGDGLPKAFAVDQFAMRGNRPDIILERLGSENTILINYYNDLYKKRLRKSGISEDELLSDIHTPNVEVIEKNILNKDGIKGKHLNLKFRLSDSKYKIALYNIYLNDVPLYSNWKKIKDVKNLDISKVNFKDGEILEETIELMAGENKIEVSCINEHGAESFRDILHVEFKPDKQLNKNLYYIGFGVSQYKDNKLNLRYADKDALDMEKLFKTMKCKDFGGSNPNCFKSVYTKVYTNEAVTPENIKSAKTGFFNNAKPDDTFVLFISGHGFHDKNNEFYYITHGTDISDVQNTAANFELIEDIIEDIPPIKKLFFMDTCESGEVDENYKNQFLKILTDSKNVVTPRAIKNEKGMTLLSHDDIEKKRKYLFEKDRFIHNDIFRRSGGIVFSSSHGSEYSYESQDYNNGFFTHAIKEAFNNGNADVNKDGTVSTDELKLYVHKVVSKLSKGAQNPTVDRDNIYLKIALPNLK